MQTRDRHVTAPCPALAHPLGPPLTKCLQPRHHRPQSHIPDPLTPTATRHPPPLSLPRCHASLPPVINLQNVPPRRWSPLLPSFDRIDTVRRGETVAIH
eukprot:264402-Rhodomonas_salina.1